MIGSFRTQILLLEVIWLLFQDYREWEPHLVGIYDSLGNKEKVKMGRFVLIVLDSFGVGAMDDCVEVRPRDVGSNTAKHIIQSKPDIKIPTLEKLGLMNAIGEEVGEHKFSDYG